MERSRSGSVWVLVPKRDGMSGTEVESRDQQDVDVSFVTEAGTRRGKASANRAGVSIPNHYQNQVAGATAVTGRVGSGLVTVLSLIPFR